MVEGTWATDNGFGTMFYARKDPISPKKQASMWVTRFDLDGRVQWSHIPLHAAMIYGAPFQVVKKLLDLYPEGIRCTDDLGMLPIHLAIKHASNANVLRMLLESFPESIFAKDNMGRGPFQVKKDDRTKILTLVAQFTTQRIQSELGEIKDKQLQEVYHDLMIQKELNEGLEAELEVNNKLMENTKRQPGLVDSPLLTHRRVQPPSKNSKDLYCPPSEYPQKSAGMWNDDGRCRIEERQEGNTSAIQRLDRELRSEKRRLEEKNRLNRALRDEKRLIEEKLRETQKQVKTMTNRQLVDDLRYSRERIAALKEKQALRDRDEQLHFNESKALGRKGFSRAANMGGRDDLDERIQQSQENVNRLLQGRSRGKQSKAEAHYLKSKNVGSRYIATTNGSNSSGGFSFSQYGDEMSEVTSSIDGRSMDEMRGGLHKLMKQDLMRKEGQLRNRLQRMRHSRNYD
eukprot:scaffold22753_cov160-Cylindrotheca_fusiformis.AAC.4